MIVGVESSSFLEPLFTSTPVNKDICKLDGQLFGILYL